MEDSDEEKLFGAGGDSSDSSSSDSDAPSPTKPKPNPTAETKTDIDPQKSSAPNATSTTSTAQDTSTPNNEKTTTAKPVNDLDEETRRLFGGDDDSSSSSSSSDSDDSDGGASKIKKLKQKPKRKEGEKEKEEEEEEEIVVEPTVVDIPALPRLKDTSEVRFSRLPNLLHLAPYAFDKDTYSEDKEMKQLKKLGKELVGDNIVRWRVKRDEIHQPVLDENTGNPLIESNARFVEWSDGSIQLLLGEETFEVLSQPSQGQFLYAMSVDTKNDKTFLEAHGRIKADLRFRPTSLSSTAHKDLELKVKGRNLKSTKLLQTATLVDPEREQEERAKAREDALRLKERQRAKNEYEYGKRSKSKQWSKGFLEEGSSQQEYDDEEEYGTSVKAIKEKYRGKSRSRARRAFSSSESSEEEEEEERNVAKKRKPIVEREKRAAASSSSQREESKSDDQRSTSRDKAEAKVKAASEASEEAKTPAPKPATPAVLDDKDEDIVQVSKKRRTNLIDSDSD